jgi:uroporphyrinogen decarboxylase
MSGFIPVGNVEQIILDLVEMGVDVLNPVQPEVMDIYKIKEKYGDKITFWGGISTQQTLPYGTPEEVKQETDEVITKMSKGGGYIASPAQAIQGDVPVENMIALLETCQSFAKL